MQETGNQVVDPEYAKLVGALPPRDRSRRCPRPAKSARKLWTISPIHFTTTGPNDKGIGIQLAYSIARVGLGFLLAALVAIPIGFLIGMSPLLYRALDPFIQVLKPISPLAWMPLALYTIKDAAVSSVFVIFICSMWPMLINTAFGVASVRREWLNVAKTLEVGAAAQGVPRDPAGRGADDNDRHAHLDRHRVAGDRRRRDARRRHRHRLFRLERVEQPVDRQHDLSAILAIGLVGMLLDLVLGEADELVTFPE